jgi:hemolysin III
MTMFELADIRPRLRGWLHLGMVPLVLAGTVVLLASTSTGAAGKASIAVFGGCLLGLYGTSGMYHTWRWPAKVRTVLGRVDTAMIVLLIAGTFTPIAFHTLDGAWRVWSLVVAWLVAVVGATLAASPLKAPRWLGTVGYIAFGWLGVVPLIKIGQALPLAGSGLIALGGILYTLGGVVYARRRPDPWPRWFGFHEVFHLLVIAGTICHYLAIWGYVL